MTVEHTDAELDQLLSVARTAAEAGARTALAWRERADELRIGEKAGPSDLVSQADQDAEEAIRAVLAEQRPDDGVLGEEQDAHDGASGIRWIVDPIDGTTSYLYGRTDWSVSVAAARTTDDRLLAGVVAEAAIGRLTQARAGARTRTADGPVPLPAAQDLSRALVEINLGRDDQRARAGRMVDSLVPCVRDLRRSGSAAAALTAVATGRADAAWVPGLQPWDCAAGVLLVQQAGGIVGDLSGPTPGTWPPGGDVLAAAPALWEPLRRLLSVAYGPAPVLSPTGRTIRS
jgi:myo-inositol-1(or 4)-monophosphatase